MKGIKIGSWVVAVLLAFTSVGFAQSQITGKIGYVDLSRLFDEYYKTKEYDKVLEGKFNQFQDEMKTKAEKIREEQSKLSLLSDDKKRTAEENLEKLTADAMTYEKDQKTSLTKERNEKIRDILLEIEGVVKAYAKAENYMLILNDRVLIYGQDPLNITEAILKQLNDGAPAEAPAKKK